MAPDHSTRAELSVRSGFNVGLGIILALVFVFVILPVLSCVGILAIGGFLTGAAKVVQDRLPGKPQEPQALRAATGPAPSAEPVEGLKPLLARLVKTTVEEVKHDGKGWYKVLSLAINVAYDVRKTDSLVSPYLSTIRWGIGESISAHCASKEQARKASVPTPQLFPNQSYSASLAFQGEHWVVKDVALDFEYRGTQTAHYNPVQGGEAHLSGWWKVLTQKVAGETVRIEESLPIAQADEREQQRRDNAYEAERRRYAEKAGAERQRKQEAARQEEADRQARVKERAEEAARQKRLREEAATAQRDKAAAAKLKFAKQLIDLGNTEVAKIRLEQLIKEYPGTKAAVEAEKLLKDLKE